MRRLIFFLRMWRMFNLRVLTGRPWRTVAVVMGIALGAAVFGSVRLAVKASLDSFERSMDAISGKADHTVTRPGGRVPEGLVARLLDMRGVAAASPLLSTYVRSGTGAEDAVLLVGIDPLLDRPLRTWADSGTRRGAASTGTASESPGFRLMAEPRTLFLGKRFMDERGLSAGDHVRLVHLGAPRDFLILGALEAGGIGDAHGGDVAVCDIATFQEFTGTIGEVDRIDLVLEAAAARRAVIEAIRAALPAGCVLERPSEERESGSLMIGSYQLNLSILSFVSLFVGMFLIYSLVSLHATARRKEIAVLRALGASSRLVFGLFLADGAFFGLVGWFVALPLGSFLVRRLLEQVSSTITLLFVRVRVQGLSPDAWELALSFGMTLLVALVAVCQPAFRAMRVPPRDALSERDATRASGGGSGTGRRLARTLAPGIACIGIAWPLAVMPPWNGMPVPGYLATFCLFVGFSLLAPAFLALAGSGLAPFLGRIGGVPACLAARQVRDSGARSAVSVGALVTAIALFTALSIMIHSFRGTVAAWVERSITGDLFIRAKMAEVNHYRDPLPPSARAALESLRPGVDILPYRRIHLLQGGVPFQFEPADLTVFHRHSSFLMMEGDFEALLPALERGEGVIVSEVFSNQTGSRVGDRFRTRVSGVEIDLPVLGIFRDYRTQGGVVYMSIARYAELTGDHTWSGARLHLAGGAGGGSEDAARRLGSKVLSRLGDGAASVDLTLGTELRRNVLRIFDETFAVTTALLVVALVIAALGIMTTLTVLVLDRLRQLNTLIAQGAARSQVRAMIFWEALLMVAGGEIIGSACGFALSTLLIRVINRQSFGWTFVYAVDWRTVLVSIPLVLGAALLAALPAMKAAFREPPAMVLRE